jgi:hypothetical protein
MGEMLPAAVLVRRLVCAMSCLAYMPCAADAQTANVWTTQNIPGATASQSDRVRFVYQMLSGDVQITARIDSLSLQSNTGLMLRASLQPEAAHAAVVLNPTGGVEFQHRPRKGEPATSDTGDLAVAPQWLGLKRSGSRVVAYASHDGERWTPIGSSAIELGAAVYVGIVTGEADDVSALTAVSQVSVSGLPADVRERDIGGPAKRGKTQHRAGTYEVVGGGAGIRGTQDQFHFVYQRMRGDVDVVARVASLGDGAQGARAGVMIRETFQPQSPHASALMVAGNGYAFDWRAESGAVTEHADGGPAAAPGWVRLVRRGTNFEAFRSDDQLTWTSMGSSEIAMSEDVYVGLAVTSQDDTTAAPALLDAVSVTLIGLPNLPPTVALVTPANGARFAAPATVTLTALAADPDGLVTHVEFNANGNRIGTASALPHTLTWSSVPAGSYTLTAVAADAAGARTTSAPVSITVEPSNQTPTVTLTAPANGATSTAPATVTLTASASDPENGLARVEFYRGTTLLGTATAPPYSFTWSSVPAGSYTLTAVAADQEGARTTSAPVSITVAAPNQPPTVTLTSPASGATFTAPATVTLTASASDPESHLARVEFYSGTTLLGAATAPPYSFTWSSVPAGSYTLTAVAVDADGARRASAAVNITVYLSSSPRFVMFTASTDHDTNVTSYLFEVFPSGADPETAPPIASKDLGKPSPDANHEITSDEAAFFSALSPGNYLATVTAVGPGGRARSSPAAFVR